MKKIFWTLFIAGIFGSACSAKQEKKLAPTIISGQITVADSVDQTGDYSNFEVLIYSKVNTLVAADTVFYALTDSSGKIDGIIELTQTGAFPVQISRNGTVVSSLRLLLAGGDTVSFSGEFPSFIETFEVDSKERRAMNKYNSVDKGFQITNQYILAGEIEDSLIGKELQKWSDLYFEVFNAQKGTIASKLALESGISLLNRYDRPQMISRLNEAFSEDLAFGLAITLGKQFIADNYGFDRTVAYLDSVKSLTNQDQIDKAIEQAIVKLHYDSSRVQNAIKLLNDYNSKYNTGDSDPTFWYKNMRYELTYLAPNMPIPAFSFETTEGETVTHESLLGSSYILEFTQMANSLYQRQYDEATVIYQIYNAQGLGYYTIPFDQSSNTIIAFFEERDRFWSIAEPPSFNKKIFADNFNIQFFPTRILVNKQGKIVRKFVGDEFENIIPAITQTLISN